MRAVCPIWTPAAELDLALVEVLLELGPLLLGGRGYSSSGHMARRRTRKSWTCRMTSWANTAA